MAFAALGREHFLLLPFAIGGALLVAALGVAGGAAHSFLVKR
jgi:hypothetical protein